MASVIGLLGSLSFSATESLVLTFRDLQIERSERWTTHEVIGRKPILEHIGPQLKTVSFTIPLNSFFCRSTLGALKLLEEMAESKEPQRLIVGPDYFGKFVIESISETRSHHTNLGIPVAASVTINLKEAAE